MSPAGSITRWIGQLKGGDGAAATPLWERYGGRLIGLARARLRGRPFLAGYEEDVAQSAFYSFCKGAQAGRFTRLSDRKNLWPLLALITVRKAIDLIVKEAGQMPPGGSGISQVPGPDLPPDLAAAADDAVRRLLDLLPNEDLRQAARMRLDGYSNDEIAAKFQRSSVTIERWFNIIRQCWRAEPPS